jgi:hypothetical protein
MSPTHQATTPAQPVSSVKLMSHPQLLLMKIKCGNTLHRINAKPTPYSPTRGVRIHMSLLLVSGTTYLVLEGPITLAASELLIKPSQAFVKTQTYRVIRAQEQRELVPTYRPTHMPTSFLHNHSHHHFLKSVLLLSLNGTHNFRVKLVKVVETIETVTTLATSTPTIYTRSVQSQLKVIPKVQKQESPSQLQLHTGLLPSGLQLRVWYKLMDFNAEKTKPRSQMWLKDFYNLL